MSEFLTKLPSAPAAFDLIFSFLRIILRIFQLLKMVITSSLRSLTRIGTADLRVS